MKKNYFFFEHGFIRIANRRGAWVVLSSRDIEIFVFLVFSDEDEMLHRTDDCQKLNLNSLDFYHWR